MMTKRAEVEKPARVVFVVEVDGAPAVASAAENIAREWMFLVAKSGSHSELRLIPYYPATTPTAPAGGRR